MAHRHHTMVCHPARLAHMINNTASMDCIEGMGGTWVGRHHHHRTCSEAHPARLVPSGKALTSLGLIPTHHHPTGQAACRCKALGLWRPCKGVSHSTMDPASMGVVHHHPAALRDPHLRYMVGSRPHMGMSEAGSLTDRHLGLASEERQMSGRPLTAHLLSAHRLTGLLVLSKEVRPMEGLPLKDPGGLARGARHPRPATLAVVGQSLRCTTSDMMDHCPARMWVLGVHSMVGMMAEAHQGHSIRGVHLLVLLEVVAGVGMAAGVVGRPTWVHPHMNP